MIDRTETKPQTFNPLYPENLSSYSPHWSIHFFYVAEEENLFDNQELLKLVIISFIPLFLTPGTPRGSTVEA